MNNELSDTEEKQITELLDKEDQLLKKIYSKLNGGFYESHVFNYDNEFIDVEFKFGVSSGGPDDRTTTEQAKINRKTMTWEN